MSNGSNAQVTETHTYLSYEIIDQGNTLINYFSKHQDHSVLVSKGDKEVQLGYYKPIIRLAPRMKIFPNPVKDNLKITLKGEIQKTGGNLSIYTVEGSLVFGVIVPPKTADFNIHLSDLSTGIYFVKIDNGFIVLNDKFIKY